MDKNNPKQGSFPDTTTTSQNSPNATATSIKIALEKNQKLQKEIQSRIRHVALLKSRNRRKASLIKSSLYRLWEKNGGKTSLNGCGCDEDGMKLSKEVLQGLRQREKERLQQAQVRQQQPQLQPQPQPIQPSDQNNQIKEEEKSTKSSIKQKPTIQSVPSGTYFKNKWKNDPTRRWNRRFFVDPEGSIPPHNADTIKRRKLNGYKDENDDKSIITFVRDYKPWTKKEIKLLNSTVETVRAQQQEVQNMLMEKSSSFHHDGTDDDSPNEAVIIRDGDVDFEKVANLMHLQQQQQSQSKNVNPRTAQECRLLYTTSTSPSISKSKFTKQEILTLLQLVHEYKKNPRYKESPPWDIVASKLKSGRTPWQCFQLYQSKFHPSLISTTSSTTSSSMTSSSSNQKIAPSSTWSPSEDELLLKYITAHGPQFVFSANSTIQTFISLFFPERTVNQVMFRLNCTLCNFNYRSEVWSDEEERKLVLCMKVYRDAGLGPIVKATNHFPDRASKYVSVKWNRSLDPKYTSKPFTPSEDAALLRAVQRALSSSASYSNEDDHPQNSNTSDSDNNTTAITTTTTTTKSITGEWMSIAKQFPNREPRVLQNRWLEISRDGDVLRKKFCDDFKANFAARRGVVGRTVTKRRGQEDEKEENSDNEDDDHTRHRKRARRSGCSHGSGGALLSPDDLMVRLKKR